MPCLWRATEGCSDPAVAAEIAAEVAAEVVAESMKVLLALVTITLTLVTRTTSCIWGVQMNSGKCGESPAVEDSG